MITSPDNTQLKLIRSLARKKERDKTCLFVAEGEDLIESARVAGWEPEVLLRSGEDIEPDLLDRASALGSGSRVIGVYGQRWSEPGGERSVYLHGAGDPGNVGTVIRCAHALCDGPVVLGTGCADPYSPKAVRAAMGSNFARPPARAAFHELSGATIALHAAAQAVLADEIAGTAPPVVLCVGAEREGLPESVLTAATTRARIPVREGGPESLNVAMAATIGLYELARRMAPDA